MRRMISLYGSSVGKKVCMAASGVILVGFVVVHMLGNLKAFQGREAYNAYSHFLREVGYPLVPESSLLWVARLLLLTAAAIHVGSAYQLWRQSRAARTERYTKFESQVFSYASRTMRWGGVIVLAFTVYHLLHLTTGTVHPDFEAGAVYDNLIIGFQSIPVTFFYLLAVGALGLHLYHGVWSAFATAGLQNPRVERIRRPIAAVLAWGVVIGYAIIPLAVWVGILGLEG